MIDSRMLTDHLYQGKYEEPLALEVCICQDCGYSIFEGEEYYNIEDAIICEECISGYKETANID